jgi:hypothetical protein
MDGLDSRALSYFEDLVDSKVALRRGCRANAVCLICFQYVKGPSVGFGIDGHGVDSKFPACTYDSDGDLATVGDEKTFEHSVRVLPGKESSIPIDGGR